MKHPVARAALWIVGVLVVLLAAGAGLVYFLISRLDVRAEIEKAVEQATGRDLTIEGNVGVSFWPVLGLRAEKASLANIEGGRAPVFASIEELDIGVDLMPLLHREVSVRDIVLNHPRLYLEIDRKGAPNWVFKPAAASTGAPAPNGTPPSGPAQATPFSLASLRTIDGEASFYDARANAQWSMSEANFNTAIPSLDQPMRLRGSLVYNRERVGLDMTIGAPRAVVSGQGTSVKAKLDGPLLEADFDGEASAKDGQITGTVSASGASLRRLSAWLGAPINGGYGLENFSVSGNLALGAKLIAFSNAAFTLDALNGRGDFELSQFKNKPFISGRLEMFAADFNPYIFGVQAAQPPAQSAAAPGVAAPASAGGEEEPGAARALDVQAAPNERPIDFSGLNIINCDLELVTHAMTVQQMHFDSAHMNLDIHDGSLASTLYEMTLYGGTGRGRVHIDASGADVAITQELSVDGVDANRFLSDAFNFPSIEGKAEASLSLVSHGRSQSDFIANAKGRAHIEVVSGAVRGVDMGGVAETIANAVNGDLIAPSARTRFNGFSATFALAGGKLASDSLSFNTPDLSIRGVGVFDLSARHVDLRLAPRSPRGGTVWPFSMRGAFDHMTFDSDIRGRDLREITAAVRAVQAGAR